MDLYFETANLNIDLDAVFLSEKILLIIFVILPTITNVMFIFIIILRHGMESFTQCRYTIRLAMAVGGILFGMFSNLTLAVSIFEGIGCIPFYLARIYELGFIPVLYSFGFIILAVDIVVRSKLIQSRTKSSQLSRFMTIPPFAIVAGLLPWIGALALVCPLTLTHIDWDNHCHRQQSQAQMKAQYIIFGIALPCATLVTAIICGWLIQEPSKTLRGLYNSSAVEDTGVHDISELTSTNNDPSIRGVTEIPNTHETLFSETQSGSTNLDALNTAASTNTAAITSNDNRLINQVDDALCDRKKICSELLNILVCSVIFAVSVVPHHSLILYILDNFHPSPYVENVDIYKTNKDLFIGKIVLTYIMSLYPVLVPLISLVV